MFRHLLKQFRYQGRDNFWILLELFVVFILMWFITDFFSTFYISSRTPTGFDIDNTYSVKLSLIHPGAPKYITYDPKSKEAAQNYMKIIDRLKQHPGIEDVCFGEYYPYSWNSRINKYQRDTLFFTNARVIRCSPEYFKVFRVSPYYGGTPEELAEKLDDGIIISHTMEEDLFPDGLATGNTITTNHKEFSLVTGVTTPLKEHEYSRSFNYIFFPITLPWLMDMNEKELTHMDICFRTHSVSSERDFANTLKNEMQNQLTEGNFYLDDIIPMSVIRKDFLSEFRQSLQFRMGFVLFFLMNIFLGIIGTFWIKVGKRNNETGLRIALGASKFSILKYTLAESLLLLIIASVPAIIVCLNLAKLELLPVSIMDITSQRIMLNTLLTLIILMIVVILATWYPARRAAKVQPAEALHYE